MISKVDWPGWPSRDHQPVMEITLTVEEMRSRYGFEFIREKDQLGWFYATHFVDDDIGPVVIYCYDYSPNGGATVLVDSGADRPSCARRIREFLRLMPEEILVTTE